MSNTMTITSEYRSTKVNYWNNFWSWIVSRTKQVVKTMMRSLIKDVGEHQQPLTLTAMDFLYVKWRVSTTVNLSDITGTINISGTNYNYTMRPANWNVDLPAGDEGSNFFSAIASSTSVSSGFHRWASGLFYTDVRICYIKTWWYILHWAT